MCSLRRAGRWAANTLQESRMSYLGPVAAVQRVVSHWASHEGAEPCAEGRADPGPPPTTILSPATNHNRQQVSHTYSTSLRFI